VSLIITNNDLEQETIMIILNLLLL